MGILNTLTERKIIDNLTSDKLADILDKKKSTFYIGFDPTSDSIHVGQLMVVNLVRLLQSYGHHAIILIGGATGLVGDPGGKDKERPLIDKEKIDRLKNNILILHPGPINRGVEITSDIVESNNSIILDQVENGVAIRMAVIYLLASKMNFSISEQ